MTKVVGIRHEDHTIRLVLLDGRWWVFCDDAAPQIDQHLSPQRLFADAPEKERRIASVNADPPTNLVSARYLLRLLHKSQRMDHSRFRAWLRAWKIVSGAVDLSGET